MDVDSAYMIEILEFEGPPWLTLQIIAQNYDTDSNRYYFHFNKTWAPRSIILANRKILNIDLREENSLPSRSKGEVFLANITVLPKSENGIYFDILI